MKTYFSILLCVSFSIAAAQESINASGGNAVGVGGTASYSVGQMPYTTETSSTGSLSQGVQHAYEILTVGVFETETEISMGVYPNPTYNNLTLQVSDCKKQNLSYQLFDEQGKVINSGIIASLQTQFSISEQAAAAYYLRVLNAENKTVQSFKIIKY